MQIPILITNICVNENRASGHTFATQPFLLLKFEYTSVIQKSVNGKLELIYIYISVVIVG